MLKFASLIVLIIGTQLAGYESAMAGNAPPSTVPSANGGKPIKNQSACVKDASGKFFISCNGFTQIKLTAGLANYTATVFGPEGQATELLRVYSHDPAKPLSKNVAAGDSFSYTPLPSRHPTSTYYVNNIGPTRGYIWNYREGDNIGSAGMKGFKSATTAGVDNQANIFFGNIHSQSNLVGGRLMVGNSCRVAGIAGTRYFISDPDRLNGGNFVQSAYCIGDGGGPLLSSIIRFAIPGGVKTLAAWEINDTGDVPLQSPPPPLKRMD